MMKSGTTGTAFGLGMIAGSVPCTLAIALFLYLMDAREAGHPIAGDALGLMMISLLAYATALISFFCGIVYFGFAAMKSKVKPSRWQWLAIVYSFSQVTIPVVYFSTR
ncbi:MAG: hypothetical protein ACXWC4_06625 [Telluria sp.]